MKEQDKLKEEKINENKRKIKHDLMELRHQQIKEKNIDPIKYSKYPINKNVYELSRNNPLIEKNKEDNDDSDYVTVHFKDQNKTQHNFQFGNYKFEIDDKKLFLDAYKKVLLKNEKNSRKNKNNGNKKWVHFTYHHPGVYREFKYKIKGDPQGEEKFMAWSCCNNVNKNAKGCQKVKIDKCKWNYDSA